MLKKLLYFALPIAALTVIGMQTASADYYDCEGNVRPGTPGPSQCHYLTQPPSALPDQPEQTTPPVIESCPNGNCGIYQYTPQLQPFTLVVPQDEPEEIVPDEDEVTEIRNSRKYCVRDYCYIIYEICYSNGYCEKKAERIGRDQMDQNDNDHGNNYYWGNQLNNYVYNYFYYNYYYGRNDDCDYRNRNCVYRGSHYGRYTNRYWDF